MQTSASVSVIIPTWRAHKTLPRLLQRLREQSIAPGEILIIDSCSDDDTLEIARLYGSTILTVQKEEFDHGKTRNIAAAYADADILVFLSQDAIPVNQMFLENICRPIAEGCAAAYARQIASSEAPRPEAYLRMSEYPPESHTRDINMARSRGVRGFYFSNAASAVRRSTFFQVGCFPERIITNEDMVLCRRLLEAGHTIRYEATAVVEHWHKFTVTALFKRYFDMGVFTESFRIGLPNAAPVSEGARFILRELSHFVRRADLWSLFRAGTEALVKAAAYAVGSRHRLLPIGLKRHLSSRREFWR